MTRVADVLLFLFFIIFVPEMSVLEHRAKLIAHIKSIVY